jgi:hypothetical protein
MKLIITTFLTLLVVVQSQYTRHCNVLSEYIYDIETEGIEKYFNNRHLFGNVMKEVNNVLNDTSDFNLLCGFAIDLTAADIRIQVERFGSSNIPELTRKIIIKLNNLRRKCCRYNRGRK